MKVPSLIINTDERREIIKDSNKKYQPKSNHVVAQQLEDFGYLNYSPTVPLQPKPTQSSVALVYRLPHSHRVSLR